MHNPYNPSTPEGQRWLQKNGVELIDARCYFPPKEEEVVDEIDTLFDWCFPTPTPSPGPIALRTASGQELLREQLAAHIPYSQAEAIAKAWSDEDDNELLGLLDQVALDFQQRVSDIINRVEEMCRE